MEIKTRLVKNGNSYGLAIPKALVECKVLEKGKFYKVTLEILPDSQQPQPNAPLTQWLFPDVVDSILTTIQ